MSENNLSESEVSHDLSQDEGTEAARVTGKQKSSSGKTSSKKRKSRYDTLEEKFNSKLNSFDKTLDEKMELFMSQMTDQMKNIVQNTRGQNEGQGRENDVPECSQRTISSTRPQRSLSPDIIVESQRSTSPEAHSSESQRPENNNRSQRSVSERNSRSQRPLHILASQMSQRQSPDRNFDEESLIDDDQISLQPDRVERAVFDESEDELRSEDENMSDKAKKCLFDLFGEDALTKKSDKKTGIVLDDSQKQVLSGSWRSEKPNSITAFAEETLDSFPVDEETEKFLEVPSLDDIIERCLIKKYGKKASFSNNKSGTGSYGKTLFSQPYKMVEKIAYRGQQAAYVGILSQLYVQQGLGTLIENLSEENFDKDKAIQTIRDVFAMTTKGLDQLGRTGAFHHIIRRQLAMTDSSLYTLEDNRDISDLPLVSKGVFGDKLESTLKSNKEKKKTLDDLLPNFNESKDRKRKNKDNELSASAAKKPYTNEKDRQSNFAAGSSTQKSNNSFRIPKIPQGGFSYDRKNKSSGSGTGQQKGKGKGDHSKGKGSGFKGTRKQ